jgi:hypothetical protein
MNLSFTIQGSTAAEIRHRAMEVVNRFAPNLVSNRPPDLVLGIDVTPLSQEFGSLAPSLWEAAVTATINVHALRAEA